jgi:hypothetical protein
MIHLRCWCVLCCKWLLSCPFLQPLQHLKLSDVEPQIKCTELAGWWSRIISGQWTSRSSHLFHKSLWLSATILSPYYWSLMPFLDSWIQPTLLPMGSCTGPLCPEWFSAMHDSIHYSRKDTQRLNKCLLKWTKQTSPNSISFVNSLNFFHFTKWLLKPKEVSSLLWWLLNPVEATPTVVI